jgi:hypothetical protein
MPGRPYADVEVLVVLELVWLAVPEAPTDRVSPLVLEDAERRGLDGLAVLPQQFTR